MERLKKSLSILEKSELNPPPTPIEVKAKKEGLVILTLQKSLNLKALNKGASMLKPKRGKTERQKAKKAAWDACSAYVRTRDCLRFSGRADEGYCVSCSPLDPTQGILRPYKELQAGHFVAGRGNTVLFDTRLIYSQCKGCNMNPPNGKGGNYVEYFVFMEKEWGRNKIDEFRSLKAETRPYKIHDFLRIEQEFKDRTAKICAK